MSKSKPSGLDRVRTISEKARRRNCQVCALPEEAHTLIREAIEATEKGERITRSALERVLREDFGYDARSVTTLVNHLKGCIGRDPWLRN